jgi:hypothetical protein
MPKYYLHLRNGDTVIKDPDGTELVDLHAARREAVAAGREILAERVRTGQVIDRETLEICDEAGNLLAEVILRDLIRLP